MAHGVLEEIEKHEEEDIANIVAKTLQAAYGHLLRPEYSITAVVRSGAAEDGVWHDAWELGVWSAEADEPVWDFNEPFREVSAFIGGVLRCEEFLNEEGLLQMGTYREPKG